MAVVDQLHDCILSLVTEGFDHEFGKPPADLPADPVWQKLRATGTRLWLDTGDIDEAARLFTAEFDALTTNNTLLNKEVQKGIYDDLVRRAARTIRDAAPDISEHDLLLEIAFVLNAYHGLRLVGRFDAFVSVELHTDLADDVDASVAYGRRYHAICPERFIVKIPLTAAGFLSARKLSAESIPVNFTLGFSARQNYMAALVSNPDYVNVFMGRLGAFLADNQLGSGDKIGEKTTLATQREILELRRAHRTKSLLIGASMRKGAQVPALAGLDVFTMPPKVAGEYIENPAADITSRIHDDPEVPFAPGVTPRDLNAATLWEVSYGFKQAVERLLPHEIDQLDPNGLREHFARAGFPDFLPDRSPEDIQTVTTDGKIPPYPTWKNRLASESLGLDALFNLCALHSFATDQKALDDRVRRLTI